MPTLKQKIEMYEGLLHDLHFAQVAMNNDRIVKLLLNISNWSYSHRMGNGELTDTQQKKLINGAFKKLRDIK